MKRIIDAETGDVLVEAVETPRPFGLSSARGLLGRDGLAQERGLLLRDPLRAVHTFGMRFPIDVVFLDRRLTVVGLAERLRPGRVTAHRRGRWQLELDAGVARRTGLVVGRRLRLVDASREDGGWGEPESPHETAVERDPDHVAAAHRCGPRLDLLFIPLAGRPTGATDSTEGEPPCAPIC